MCATGTCPKTIDYLLQHEHAYQKELAFIENPPEGVEVIQIFAPKKLQSKLLGSSDAQLRHDYKLGQYAGAAFLEAEGKAQTHYESVAAFTKAKLAKEANEDSIRIAARLNNTLSENAQAKRSAFTLPLPAQAKADKNESRMSA